MTCTPKMNKSNMYIAIAGNIGSGKTTLTGLLAEHFGCIPLHENLEDNPYISDFYTDMRRWAFNLQIYFLQKRFATIIEAHKNNKYIIQDRTLYEDAYIFAPNLYGLGLLSDKDYDTYISLFNLMISLTPTPDLLIYLRASVSTLFNLIVKRGRKYESSIRLDYLSSLNQRYEKWIESYNGRKIVIDVDNFDINNGKEVGKVIEKIDKEIKDLF